MKQLSCAAPYAHQPRGRLMKISLILVLAAASLAPAASATERQGETQAAHQLSATTPTEPGDENWVTGFNQRGLDGGVFALALDNAGHPIAGGDFDRVGGVSVSSIATWHGTTWSPLGSGVNGVAEALALDYAGSPYAGGNFTAAGGAKADSIAKWDDAAWSPLGSGMNDYVFALALDDAGNLYAGGRFTAAGGASANFVAKWNGAAWLPLTSGMNGGVCALGRDKAGNLYAGGGFTLAGGVNAHRVAKWDTRTSSWSPLGDGIDCDYCLVRALAVDRVNGPIYAGGDFYSTGLGHVAKWDGTAWSSLGSGVWGVEYPQVFALAVDRAGNLYVGGVFTYASGVRANYIARWDGTAWSPLGSGMNDIVYALALDDSGNLYAGGHFTMAGGISANGVAKWDGTAWSPLGSGIGHPYYPEIHALAFDSTGNLYAGGVFNTAGGSSANYVAKWDGDSWSALGSGLNNQVHALAVAPGGLAVYTGGEFLRAGGKPSSYIAQWTPVCCQRYLPLIMRR